MEIETKIPLSKQEFESLLANIKETEKYEVFCKQDYYFSKFNSKEERNLNNEPLIRIRDLGVNKIKFFTLKRKSVQNNVEINEEKETEVIDISPLEELLRINNYKIWFSKKKESTFWQKSFNNISINCELIIVNDKYYYFELEVANYKSDKSLAKDALKLCAENYNLDIAKADNRYWTEILT